MHGEILEFSVQEELLRIFAVTGPIAAIAQALNYFWHRNDGKRIEIGAGDERVVIQGKSTEEVINLLQRLADRKAEKERAFRELMGGNEKEAEDGDSHS